MSDVNQPFIDEFRANQGQVGGFFEGKPLILLTTTGGRSGLSRTSLMTYSIDAGDPIVTAANGGRPTHPGWYHNLVADPEVTVELPGEMFRARAIVTEGAERDRLFAVRAQERPNFAMWQRETDRQFPVIRLRRI